MSRYHTHNEKEGATLRDRKCDDCVKKYDAESSPCSRCGVNVTNGAFFKKTSPHFKGTCKPAKAFPDTIPEQSWKRAVPYPMPRMPKYDKYLENGCWPSSLEELCKFWGVPAVGDRVGVTCYSDPMDPTAYDELAGKIRLAALLAEQNTLLKQLAQREEN